MFKRKSKPVQSQSQIRWLIRADMDAVLDIEHSSFDHPWSEREFLSVLRERNVIGSVYQDFDGIICGFMIYELHKDRLQLINIAVDPEARRSGVGTEMLNRLKSKLKPTGRNEVQMMIRESNLEAQLFAQSCGFLCKSIERRAFADLNEDGYWFEYSLREEI